MSADDAARAIAARAPGFRPRVGLILGSGLGGLADRMSAPIAIGYGDLPGFPKASVEGHAGRLLLGSLAGQPVAVMQGRVHFYEGHGAAAVLAPVRALRLAGADILLITNAAGSLRPEVGPGRLVAIADHINLLPGNPLTGRNDDRFGPRFPSMRDAYDPSLRRRLQTAAGDAGIDLAEGVYLAYPGPNFETPAEIRAFRILGADLVGMSTVPEVIAARHCGLQVAALSVVTNLAEGMGEESLSHAHTLATATRAAGDLARLVCGFLEKLDA